MGQNARKLLKTHAKGKIWKQIAKERKQIAGERKHLSEGKKHWPEEKKRMSDDWKQKFGQSVRIWSQLEKGLGSVEIVARYGLGCAGRVVSGWVLVRGVGTI